MGQLGVEFDQLTLLLHKLHKLWSFQRFQSLVFAFGIDGGLHEVCHADSRNLNRILETEEDTLAGALVGFHGEQVLAVECCRSPGDGVQRIAGDDGTEC